MSSATAESQEEKNSMWHSMMSDQESNDGMTEEQATQRGLSFGWDNVFSAAADGDIRKLGQGLHALQLTQFLNPLMQLDFKGWTNPKK